MGELQGIVTFPGLSTFTRAEYCLSQGITPGVCVIDTPADVSSLARTGTLTLTYGQNSVSLSNCLVDSANLQGSQEEGYHYQVHILDRRWLWRFGYITGHFNLRMPGSSSAPETIGANSSFDQPYIRPGTQMSPQDLAAMCLDAMGEQNYDVSALPNETSPEVNWSYLTPAAALESLCNDLGCRVIFSVADDGVFISPIGEGQSLPTAGTMYPGFGINPPDPPSSLLFVGGATVYQDCLRLEPVGIDLDGLIKPINRLSYKPAGDWTGENPRVFPGLAAQGNATALALAKQSIYKFWRPVVPLDEDYLQGVVVDRVDKFILYDRRIDTYQDPVSGHIFPKKPQIIGVFDPLLSQTTGAQLGTVVSYANAPTVDNDRSLIITQEPLCLSVNGQFLPASIGIVIAFSVLNDQWEPTRFKVTRTLDPSGATQPRVVRRDEVYQQIVAENSYKSDNTGHFLIHLDDWKINDSVGNNQQAASYYLDAAQSEYIEVDSLDLIYPGIVPIQIDGLIQQVTYSIVSGPGGRTTTRASLATEHNPYVPRYGERTDRSRRRGRRNGQRVPAAGLGPNALPGGGVFG